MVHRYVGTYVGMCNNYEPYILSCVVGDSPVIFHALPCVHLIDLSGCVSHKEEGSRVGGGGMEGHTADRGATRMPENMVKDV